MHTECDQMMLIINYCQAIPITVYCLSVVVFINKIKVISLKLTVVILSLLFPDYLRLSTPRLMLFGQYMLVCVWGFFFQPDFIYIYLSVFLYIFFFCFSLTISISRRSLIASLSSSYPFDSLMSSNAFVHLSS